MIVYEAGEALRFDEDAIRIGVTGLLQVMESLGMLSSRRHNIGSRAPMVLRSSSWVRAPTSGVVRTKRRTGAQIEAGDVLAVVSDPLGETETNVESPMDGVIVGKTNLPLAHEGDALFHVGMTE